MNFIKSIYPALISMLISLGSYGQAPQQFAFQGVARNAANQLIANQIVNVRFTIHYDSETGAVVYQETHAPQTTSGGIFNTSVGAGNVQQGTFANINWGSGRHFLQVELDASGSGNYSTINTVQLQSVTYALTAKNLDGVTGPQEGETLVFKDGQCIVCVLLAFTSHAQSPGLFSTTGSGSSGVGSVTWVLGSISATDQVYEVLPVKLVYFRSARSEANVAELSWKTVSESSNAGFEVQKSPDGKIFESIGWADGKGDRGGVYFFTDQSLQTTSYYRLKQIDRDGTFAYSRIVSVIPLHESTEIVAAYPNPSMDGKVNLRLPSNVTSVRVTELGGALSKEYNALIRSSEPTIQLPRAGFYLIQVNTLLGAKTIKVIYL